MTFFCQKCGCRPCACGVIRGVAKVHETLRIANADESKKLDAELRERGYVPCSDEKSDERDEK